MAEAYIVDAVSTPVGKRGKGLAAVHPLDLAAAPLEALLVLVVRDAEAQVVRASEPLLEGLVAGLDLVAREVLVVDGEIGAADDLADGGGAADDAVRASTAAFDEGGEELLLLGD